MEKLIEINNKLQDVLSHLDKSQINLDLPQIVVIGTQSAGKSSVLESFVGREFLPRGTGIVTRRPLILRLVHVIKSTVRSDYAEFRHKPGERFTDFAKVRKEIEDETDRVTGHEKQISPEPIYLTVYSPNVVDLTLVDLPGIARVAIGNQPKDIEYQIKSMIMDYIKPQNSIILAVTPANVDIATSDSIQMAKYVDPEGIRTIGVLTKLDIMDSGTDAYDTLTGRFLPLRLGYVGVVCRGQKALNSEQSVAAAVEAENRFFSNHPRYRLIADKCGTQYLSKRLNQILIAHIKNNIPRIRTSLTNLLIETRKECDKYAADPAAYGDVSASAILLERIKVFTEALTSLVKGKDAKHSSKNELVGGALIKKTFTADYSKALEAIVPLNGYSAKEITVLMTNMGGISGSLFTSDSAFEFLVKREISLLESPSLECVERVYGLLAAFASKAEAEVLSGYPKLKDFIEKILSEMILRNRDITKEMVRNLIRIEHSYINKSHPFFREIIDEDTKKSTAPGVPPTAAESASSSSASAAAPVPNSPVYGGYEDDDFEFIGKDDDDNNSRMAPPSPAKGQSMNSQQRAAQPQQRPSPPQSSQKKGWWPWGVGGGHQEPKQSSPPPPPQQPKQQQPPAAQQQPQKTYAQKSEPYNSKKGNVVIDRSSSVNKKDRDTATLMKTLVTRYFEIVKKNIKDSVPKAIMLFLVYKTVDSIGDTLISIIMKDSGNIDELVTEDSGLVAQRKAAFLKKKTLEDALMVLNEVQSINIY